MSLAWIFRAKLSEYKRKKKKNNSGNIAPSDSFSLHMTNFRDLTNSKAKNESARLPAKRGQWATRRIGERREARQWLAENKRFGKANRHREPTKKKLLRT